MSTLSTRFSKVTDLLPHGRMGKRTTPAARRRYRSNQKTEAIKRRAAERHAEYVVTEFGRRPARRWNRKLVLAGSIAAAGAMGVLWVVL